ncbi:MAG TPA: glycosyltransferase family 4 protein [Chthoniobacterales bacterium]|nr:glycosyltransferase family 4 protein [Chthoniobacterales bacterium]
MQKPLRILTVVDLPWDARLGASRVFIELTEAWRAAGHVVTKYCLTDAYPTRASAPFVSAWRQLGFPSKAAAFVRRNHDRFDIIDCLLGTLPFSKEKLDFTGLLVARSVGFYRLYQDFERMAQERWPDQSRGKLLGRIFYSVIRKRAFKASERALENCDLLNFPNEDEAKYLRDEVNSDKPAIVQPYGLTAEHRRALLEAAAPPHVRLAEKKVSFIGMWSIRKGAKDWGEVIQRARAAVPGTRFVFLGTLTDDRNVFRDLGLPGGDFVQLVQEYHPGELPKLLSDSTVGAFPSYADGFGLAVLEQLGAGIPPVAYDVSGPRSMLREHLPELLVPAGDVEKFAAALIRVLQSDLAAYEKLAEQSIATANHFAWSTIAEDTARSYETYLARLA